MCFLFAAEPSRGPSFVIVCPLSALTLLCSKDLVSTPCPVKVTKAESYMISCNQIWFLKLIKLVFFSHQSMELNYLQLFSMCIILGNNSEK